MNKLFIGILVALVVVVGGAYLIGLNKTEAPAEDTLNGSGIEENDTVAEEEMTGSEDGNTGTETETQEPESVTIDVTGENFDLSEEEIRIKKGTRVTINFTSTDGFHDWTIDEFSASTERVNTGGTTSVTFVADTAGTFPFYCSVGNHRQLGMEGSLIVEE